MKMYSVVLGISKVLAVLALLIAGWLAYEFLMNIVAVYSFEPSDKNSSSIIRYPNLMWDPLAWTFIALIVAGLCLKFGHQFSTSRVRASDREGS